jgi:GntR family transcriptional repressor for pyruvate dehydrogenase complex
VFMDCGNLRSFKAKEVTQLSFVEVKKEKIPQSIVVQFRQNLMEGRLIPGQRLPSEIKLAEMFGVSRSSLREAMQTLEGMGMIERRKRGGTTIRQITLEDLVGIYTPKSEDETLFDLLETREVLEVSVVQLAVRRASTEELEELEKLIVWMEEEPEQAARADILFHIALARISQNQVMTNIIKSLKEIMFKLQDKTFFYPGRLQEIITEHRLILNAIKAKDEQLAQECMRQHLNKANHILEKVNHILEKELKLKSTAI